ncbi:DUF4350 domain-containing protein [Rudanella paleaurantiibacter]|uniref:DUF4350 domain-containing protein n=1 Tax=Rudanella paleaurantiibacter TaxID=2614655 RepID=A0A7J5U2G3_9BACT|nr:DUF4350 domain-containing protein [Rudanella paleaurantiibacter]KAB7731989.1 DUF4350 domain-containing protein [Rudanella paleaurantiibacter]
MKLNRYFFILLAFVLAYGLFEFYRPKPIDWSASYRNTDKIPFGTRALYELLPSVMGQASVKNVRLPVYNFLTESKPVTPSNYVFVARSLRFDDNDVRQLLRYVARGNGVFLSAYYFPDTLGRVLGFRALVKPPRLKDTLLTNQFTNPALQKRGGYNFFHDDGRNYLVTKDARNTVVLARNSRNEPTYLRIRYGKGFFYIHNLPLALTNFFVLDRKTSDYAFKALSYLPARPTYWDEYQKQGRFDDDEQSVFRYVLSQPALTWAYYLLVVGLILYALLAGKRTQRVIPVVEPPRNTSLEFVQTVGRVYYQQGDHNHLGQKMIQFFLAHLRERYGLVTTTLDAEFAEALSRRTGVEVSDAQDLVQALQAARRTVTLSEEDVLILNGKIENFRQAVAG